MDTTFEIIIECYDAEKGDHYTRPATKQEIEFYETFSNGIQSENNEKIIPHT